jgi:carbon storage regulator
MLVLTRKINQSIMIGDEIEITVLAVSGEKVRIGIEAPRDISVFRQEVLDSMEESDRPKSPPDPPDSE